MNLDRAPPSPPTGHLQEYYELLLNVHDGRLQKSSLWFRRISNTRHFSLFFFLFFFFSFFTRQRGGIVFICQSKELLLFIKTAEYLL